MIAFQQTLKNYFDLFDTVENGKDALDMVVKQAPNYYNAIVLDLNMPIMDGGEACKRMREYFEHEDRSSNVSSSVLDSQV